MATNENRISATLTAAAIANINAAVATIRTNLPFIINLDPAERKSKRKTGTKREGYVVDVYQATTSHPEAIPSSFPLTEWTKDETLNNQLKLLFSSILSLSESVDDTLLQIGFERIKQTDLAYGFLKQAAKGNAALTEIVNNIAQQFLGQGRNAPVPVTSIPAGGTVTVPNAVPDTNLSNMGNTILKLASDGTDTLIRPGDVAKVTSKQITVANQSTTAGGAFSVKTK